MFKIKFFGKLIFNGTFIFQIVCFITVVTYVSAGYIGTQVASSYATVSHHPVQYNHGYASPGIQPYGTSRIQSYTHGIQHQIAPIVHSYATPAIKTFAAPAISTYAAPVLHQGYSSGHHVDYYVRFNQKLRILQLHK